jgi:hypothetical protein
VFEYDVSYDGKSSLGEVIQSLPDQQSAISVTLEASTITVEYEQEVVLTFPFFSNLTWTGWGEHETSCSNQDWTYTGYLTGVYGTKNA